MRDLVFRLAEPAEAPLVRAISAEAYKAAYDPVVGVAPRPAFEGYADRIERREVWLLGTPEGTAGVAVLETRPDHVFVYSIAVRPRFQGQGHGKALLALAERCAVAAGLTEVRLHTNRRMHRNVALYERCGFAAVGERPHPSHPGERLVDMVKRLGSEPI